MRHKGKSRALTVAAAVAVAVAAATAAVMLTRSSGGDRKTTGNHIVGDKLLEMLFCVPGMNCGAMKSTPSLGTAAGAAAPCVFREKEVA